MTREQSVSSVGEKSRLHLSTGVIGRSWSGRNTALSAPDLSRRCIRGSQAVEKAHQPKCRLESHVSDANFASTVAASASSLRAILHAFLASQTTRLQSQQQRPAKQNTEQPVS